MNSESISAEVYLDRNIYILNFNNTEYSFTRPDSLKSHLEHELSLLRMSDFEGIVNVDVQRGIRKDLFINAEYAINTVIENNCKIKTRPYNPEHSLRMNGSDMKTALSDAMPKWFKIACDLEVTVLKELAGKDRETAWSIAVKLAKEMSSR